MKYIILLLSLFILIYSESSWTYSQCYDYLNDLNIICYSFSKNDSGIEICENWEVENISYINNLPNECFNKEYNLEVDINNSNFPLKKKLILFLEFFKDLDCKDKDLYESEENKLETSNFSKGNNNIRECIKNFFKFEKLCANINIINKKDKELCNKLEIQNKNEFCQEVIDIFDKESILKIKNVKDFDNMQIILKDEYNVFENFEQIKLIYGKNFKFYLHSVEETNDNDKNEELEFEEENNEDNINHEFNNDNNNYDDRSRKDCVEYGLDGNYIVCTKYE